MFTQVAPYLTHLVDAGLVERPVGIGDNLVGLDDEYP